jgi:DNA-directed RNA polymerase specialized sigma24 family protein
MAPPPVDHADEIVRLLALQLRLGFETQNEAILAFDKAGLTQPRIASLLGTSPGTVKDAIHRTKTSPKRSRSDRGKR